jgi:CheY-like chemotaxis protein
MDVLICDDDPTTRHVLKHLLIQSFKATVHEATHGLEALDRLSRHRYDALLLDVHMPVMDGLETLETIRESEALASLPVIVLSGEKDEGVVKQLIRLGVSDFLLKPPTAERVVGGFERLHRQITGRPRGRGAMHAIALNAGDTVALVDEDAEYRQLFEQSVAHLVKVVPLETGPEVLELALRQTPAAVFLGKNIGVLKAERVAAKLRAIAPGIRVVRLASKGDVEAWGPGGVFDDVISRSFVTTTIAGAVERLMRPPALLQRFQDAARPLRPSLVEAAEQMFGMACGADVEVVETAPEPGDEPYVFATVVMPVDAYTLYFAFRAPTTSARQIAAVFLKRDAGSLTAEEIEGVIGELAATLTARLQAGYVRAGLTPQTGLPGVGTQRASEVVEDRQQRNDDTVLLFFVTLGGSAVLEARVDVADNDAPQAQAG